MNLLQNLKIKKNIFVTLNTENIDKNKNYKIRFIMIILHLNIIKIMFKNKTI